MRCLDLFCGGGGAAMGLHRAGFEVVGVDINPQPHYPFEFHQADALTFPPEGFDFIWASPPCQHYSRAAATQRANGKRYPDLVHAMRERLVESGTPFVIENVPGAPIRKDIRLGGWMFPDLKVIRERWFEASWPVADPFTPKPRGLLAQGYLCVTGSGTPGWAYYKCGTRQTAADCAQAMGIDWMTRKELSQAIPPAYSEWIGRAFLAWQEGRRQRALDLAPNR